MSNKSKVSQSLNDVVMLGPACGTDLAHTSGPTECHHSMQYVDYNKVSVLMHKNNRMQLIHRIVWAENNFFL